MILVKKQYLILIEMLIVHGILRQGILNVVPMMAGNSRTN
jgi:hypothetical protein